MTSPDRTYVYTVSNRGKMVQSLLKSLASLTRWVDPEHIHIAETPPYLPHSTAKKLKRYQFISLPNELNAFTMNSETGKKGYYGEKLIKPMLLPQREVAFLDCDTIIKKDPAALFDGDFAVSVRADPGTMELDIGKWVAWFHEHGKIPIPMINTGVMIFQNHMNQPILRKAVEHYRPLDFPDFHRKRHLDQYALSLALAPNLRGRWPFLIKWMNQHQHSFRWMNETADTIVQHGTKVELPKKVGSMLKSLANYNGINLQ